MEEYEFVNYPKRSNVRDYDNCMIDSVDYVKREYPFASIYKVGGNNIKPGISDVDLLICAHKKFNGNPLYLRNYPRKYVKKGILIHEFFSVDEPTFKELNKITSYDLQPLVYGKDAPLIEIPPYDTKYDFFKLTYYLVVNYPANFYSFEKDKKIDVRRSLTKLKKLYNYELLLKSMLKNDGSFLSNSFKRKMEYLYQGFSDFERIELNKLVYELLIEARNESLNLIMEFDKVSKNYVNISEDSFIEVNGNKIIFSDQYKTMLYDGENYYLPQNAAVINSVFNHIDEKFLGKIRFKKQEDELETFEEVSKIINRYLNFCQVSNVSQLIFDINFTVHGYNSFKYLLFQQLRKLKQ